MAAAAKRAVDDGNTPKARAKRNDRQKFARPAASPLAALTALERGEQASAKAARLAVLNPVDRSEREPGPEARAADMGPGTKEPPNEQYLLGLRAELEQFYGSQDEQIDRLRRVRQMEEPVALPKKYRLVDVEVRSPVVADECQRVAATLSINWAKLAVTPVNESDTGQENATLRETWTEEVLRIAGTRGEGNDTLQSAIDAAVSDGGAWTKLVFNKDLWHNRFRIRLSQFKDDTEEYEEDVSDPDAGDETDEQGALMAKTRTTKTRVTKTRVTKRKAAIEAAVRAAGPPFSWVCCDTRQVYPVWLGGRLAEVLEVQERPVSTVFRQYRLQYDKQGNLAQGLTPDETWDAQPVGAGKAEGFSQPSLAGRSVVFLEHWDEEWATYFCVGENLHDPTKKTAKVVQQWRHGYGQVPYFYAPGITMSFWRNRKTGWGVAEVLRWLVEYQSYLLTLHAQVAARDTLPPFQQTSTDLASTLDGDDPSESQDDDHVPEAWDLRQILKNAPGRELKPLPMPETAQALEKHIALVDQLIEKLRAVRPSSTVGGGLDGAGFAISQLLAEARVRYDPIAQNVERMLARVTRFLWKLVREKVKEAVWVYAAGPKGGGKWRAAGPDDLGDDVRIAWKLDPERASAKLIEARYWHERMKAGTASNDQAITEMGDNPDEVREGRMMDLVRQSDFYKQRFLKRLTEKVNAGDLIQQAIADLLVQNSQQTAQQQAMELAAKKVPPGALGALGPLAAAAALGAPGGPPPGAPGGGSMGIPPNIVAGPGGAPMAAGTSSGAGFGMSPPNGSVVGAGPGAVVPTQAAAAGMVA